MQYYSIMKPLLPSNPKISALEEMSTKPFQPSVTRIIG